MICRFDREDGYKIFVCWVLAGCLYGKETLKAECLFVPPVVRSRLKLNETSGKDICDIQGGAPGKEKRRKTV